MNRGESESPIIAIIASDSYHSCRSFLKTHGLNPKCFILANRVEHVMALRRDLPVIITNHGENEKFNRLFEEIQFRFSNVRFMGW